MLGIYSIGYNQLTIYNQQTANLTGSNSLLKAHCAPFNPENLHFSLTCFSHVILNFNFWNFFQHMYKILVSYTLFAYLIPQSFFLVLLYFISHPHNYLPRIRAIQLFTFLHISWHRLLYDHVLFVALSFLSNTVPGTHKILHVEIMRICVTMNTRSQRGE